MSKTTNRLLKKLPSIQTHLTDTAKDTEVLPSPLTPQPKRMKLMHYLELAEHKKRVNVSSATIKKSKEEISQKTRVRNPVENSQIVLMQNQIQNEIKNSMKSLEQTLHLFQTIKKTKSDQREEVTEIELMCQLYRKIKYDLHKNIQESNQMIKKQGKLGNLSSSNPQIISQQMKTGLETGKKKRSRRVVTTNQ